MSTRVLQSPNHDTNKHRSVGVFVLCAALIVGIFSPPVSGQDRTPAADGNLELVPLDSAGLSDTTRMILRSIRDSDPKTPPQLVRAIKAMVDVNLKGDALVYLRKLITLGLNDQQLFELHETAGSDFFFAIHSDLDLQPEGRDFAKTVLNAAKKIATSPAKLDALIVQLNDKDVSTRSIAFRRLRLLGEPAVARLVNTFADDSKKEFYPGVRGALRNTGAEVQGPLLGGARSSDVQVQVESIRALAAINSSEAVDVMMRAYLSPKVPEYSRRIALDYLSKASSADPADVERRLYTRATEYLKGTRKVTGSILGEVTLWNWDSKSSQLLPVRLTSETAGRVVASRRASDLYEIRPDLGRNRELFLLTQLEAAKRMAGSGKLVDVEGLVSRLTTDANEINLLLKKAMDFDLVPAAVACCEILKEKGDSSLLLQSSNQPRELVQAILFGDRHLQYAAFDAITNIDPVQAYNGSSYTVALAVFLAQSDNRPMGVIGHNRDAVAQTYAATMASAGLLGQSVTTGRALFQTVIANPDVEVIMVTDVLDLPEYATLIQQLRNDWRTRRIPVALLFRDQSRARRVRMRVGNDPRFVAIPFGMEPERVASHVRQLQETIEPWSVTNFQRQKHAAKAVEWLAKIASDRANYPFYNLGAHENALARLLYIPGFAKSASSVLANLGTPRAQRELVDFASQGTVSIEDRKHVANAFSQAVKTGGALLTTKEIQLQYDRYNASEGESKETQEILGSILDALEARKRAAQSGERSE